MPAPSLHLVARTDLATVATSLATTTRGQQGRKLGRGLNELGPGQMATDLATIGHELKSLTKPLATVATHLATSETAVTRYLQLGQRPIPDGPTVKAFVEHRHWLIQLDPAAAILTRTDAYDEYATMCELGGWRAVGRNHFFRTLERLGYYPVRTQAESGRVRMLDFSQPPVPVPT